MFARARNRGAAIGFVAVVAVVMLLALPALASSAKKKTVKLTADLSGAAEVPGPGDADGTGTADLRLKPKKGKVCFDITHTGLSPDNPVAGHIHEGAPGVAGPIFILLFEDPAGKPSPISGCVKNEKSAVKKVAKNPGDFYVNLHNAEFPAGAIRGQLHK